MSFTATNLLYFVIVLPPTCAFFYCISRFVKRDSHLQRALLISIALFFVRIMLVPFAGSIGVMPHVQPELLFYCLLAAFGVGFSVWSVKSLEKQTFAFFGWHSGDFKKDVLIGVIGLLPLLAFLPVVYFSTHLTISSEFTAERLVIACTFGLALGGFFEEVMFRGIIQFHVGRIATKRREIAYTAVIFVLTHVGYLPFDAFGIYYWFLLIMAIELSYVRSRYSVVPCSIIHGGIVFLLIMLV
ncbi:MAG: CPBP family intramembrane metalloprotease [Candidatus Lokiarchaeota archaeon]|nr:CPBP family intramembrane metalloprotease [Candidatus Lokiarchaeota archaeon]